MIEQDNPTTPKPFVFVLMPFDSKFDDIYKFGIKGAADDVGAYAERVDEQLFSEGILDRIFNQISKADIIIADMTGRNPNVFYEVGYAHALGKRVILLTQNADDIPFDLKHRQHTIYSGKIELLRRELVSKLNWAIAEARSQKRGFGLERFSIRLGGIEIPELNSSDEVREVRATVKSPTFYIPIYLRNDSLETTLEITYVYLFTLENSILVPCIDNTHLEDINIRARMRRFGRVSVGDELEAPLPIDSIVANLVDCTDGLKRQFRLRIKFPALPPGAVEVARIPFMFRSMVRHAESDFRLRLHSAVQYHQYRFRLSLDLIVPKIEEGASDEQEVIKDESESNGSSSNE